MSTKKSSRQRGDASGYRDEKTMKIKHLKNRARRLAKMHRATAQHGQTRWLYDRLRSYNALLDKAYSHFAEASTQNTSLYRTAEWFLDNFTLMQQTVRQVRKDMTRGFYLRLPKLTTTELTTKPRIFAIALEIINSCEGRLQIDPVIHFVQAYQDITPLTIGEVWALPIMLRLSVLEYLTQAIAKTIDIQLSDSSKPSVFINLPEGLRNEDVIINAILNLRVLETQDWKVFFDRVSVVQHILRADPAGVYNNMDFDTRDLYRNEIEQLATATELSEQEIAQKATCLAQKKFTSEKGGSVERESHVGYYLVDSGREKLENEIGYHPPWNVRFKRWLLDHPTPLYLGSIGVLTLIILFLLIGIALYRETTPPQLTAITILLLIPTLVTTKQLVNQLLPYLISPRTLPKLDFKESIPADCRTMVVMPVLLRSIEEVTFLLRNIELHFLGNNDPHISFALLTDFPDAPEKQMPNDIVLIDQAAAGIKKLNKRHHQSQSKPFYLFHRERVWNPSEGVWMGWERKRGKLIELNRLLLNSEKTTYTLQVGDLATLAKIRYVITLDRDTILPRGSAHRLIGTLAHPLNRPQFEHQTDKVIAGYPILQPRTEITPTSANRSLFTKIFAGDTELDLYTLAVSNVYQDFFGEGIYVGKGIYDVSAFERTLRGKVPENALLSHDLFEGIHGRVGLVSDIVLFEDFPSNYLAYVQRLHRWVRGDWQLLPWLMPRVPSREKNTIPNTFSLINIWKIADNLCRSLFVPALMLLMVLAWLGYLGSALLWTVLALLTPALLPTFNLITKFFNSIRDGSLRTFVPSIKLQALRWLLTLVFLPYQTFTILDAIVRTLVRLVFTRKNLLQWTTAAQAIKMSHHANLRLLFWQNMAGTSLFSLGFALLIRMVNPEAFAIAAPFLVTWFVSPHIAYWISRHITHERRLSDARQRYQLFWLARRTWLFFEQHFTPEDHWLPPDHFQEYPRGLVVHRTSPTNIGLMLLSTLAAYDLGYIGALNLALRLSNTFSTLNKLERYRGHFLNWYDTQTLNPLHPRYVSTVDSGNLAGCFSTIKQGCMRLIHDPVIRWECWQGLLDTSAVLTEVIKELEAVDPQKVVPLLQYLSHLRQQILEVQAIPDLWKALLMKLYEADTQNIEKRIVELIDSNRHNLNTTLTNSLRLWANRFRQHMFDLQRELEYLMPWLVHLEQVPELLEDEKTNPAVLQAWQKLKDELLTIPSLGKIEHISESGQKKLNLLKEVLANAAIPEEEHDSILEWSAKLADALDTGVQHVQHLLDYYEKLIEQAEKYIEEMKFGFLFNSKRQLFHIGYNVDSEKLDSNFYDLLASEARITSLLAIAKDDIPQSHWMYLNRPLTVMDDTRGLLSWSGTMFEYLMPNLMVRCYENSLLGQSCSVAVERQITYGRQKGVPWGISESGYYGFDAHMHYQYKAFGVPGLGFKRGLGDELVITPYASILALSLQPQMVVRNIEQLIELGMLGVYGFYEAIDYTSSRLGVSKERHIVRSFMAHHQGMILLSLTNFLKDDTMVSRFHADSRIQTLELLLQEHISYKAPLEQFSGKELTQPQVDKRKIIPTPWQVPILAPSPQAHFLSNGVYGVLITSAGSGYSKWKEIDVTRWRADTTLDNWGTWIYVQDLESGDLWSTGLQPTAKSPDKRDVTFYPHKADFRCQAHNINLHMEIAVSPEDTVEIRRIKITNQDDYTRHLMLTSYGEVVLAPQENDRRHQAFNKLFIENEYLSDLNAQLFYRRTRSSEEAPIHMVHMLVVEPSMQATGVHESDRMRFLGRGRTPQNPLALNHDGSGLTGTAGATLDPIMALGQIIELKPHSTVELCYITLVTELRHEALTLAKRYQNWSVINLAFDRARSQSEIELSQLEMTPSELQRIQQLLSLLIYPYGVLRADSTMLAANTKGQSDLWAFAISGDYPIILVHIKDEDELPLVRELIRAHTYWRNRQIKIDLVIINEHETGYMREMEGHLHRLIKQTNSDAWLNQRGGIFLLRSDQMNEADQVLLMAAARVIMKGNNGSLADQLQNYHKKPTYLPAFVPPFSDAGNFEPTLPLSRPKDLIFDNELGGFSPDGHEYILYLESDRHTPAPWINVIANPQLGFTVSECGSGNTWTVNSGENRLTTWHNDPVSDLSGEALYLRDEETGCIWSPTPLPAGTSYPYLIRHGIGYSIFEHNSHGLEQRACLFAVPDQPVKVVKVRLRNTWNRTRRITVTYYAEWVLGNNRDTMQQYIIPEYDGKMNTLLVSNPYNSEFEGRVAFLAANKVLHGLTTDRTEFLGRMGNFKNPAGLRRIGLSGKVQAGLDPCAALQLHVDLPPGESEEVFFLIGQAENRQALSQLIENYRNPERIKDVWEQMIGFWNRLLGAITVKTPDQAMNILLNRWLPYQNLSCRVWGRSALYQSSGAFGFRDQLQDVMALLHSAPEIARGHILSAAAHQFKEGDVLHWWHPPSGRGIRTRISDDLLWLPFVTSEYVTITGDQSILKETIPFLEGDPLNPEEEERYGYYETTSECDTLYEHCCLAIKKGSTTGPHGLPCIGMGDWNDGMNRVGRKGQGESIWLGWFLYSTLINFVPICQTMGDDKQAAFFNRQAEGLSQIVEEKGWDGDWYLRAFYDDGTPLGSSQNQECQIDSIAQSWAVLSRAAETARAQRAMEAVYERLVVSDDKLLLLFTPPFNKTPYDPGYIKGYPPGIRENGGQYTHAALWVAWAFAELGQGDRAGTLFQMLNPIYHGDTSEKADRYRVEPYVVAADVYGMPPYNGRGGWTWYTGSAGWMYRLGIEAILGLRKKGSVLKIDPCIPKNWSEYELSYKHGKTVYRIRVENTNGVSRGVTQTLLDGEIMPKGEIPLVEDNNEHEVCIRMG